MPKSMPLAHPLTLYCFNPPSPPLKMRNPWGSVAGGALFLRMPLISPLIDIQNANLRL